MDINLKLPEKLPGEGLAKKIWASLFDNGIATLFRRFRERQTALGKADALRILAQAQKDCEDVKAGRKRVSDNGRLVDLQETASIGPETASGQVAVHDDSDYYRNLILVRFSDIVQQQMIAQHLVDEISVVRTAFLAEEEALKQSQYEDVRETISPDWLAHWEERVRKLRSEDLQRLFARALCGEVEKPGRFSLRTIDFLSKLSKNEAGAIKILSGVVIEDFIWTAKKSFVSEWRDLEPYIRGANPQAMTHLGLVNEGGGGFDVSFPSSARDRYIRGFRAFKRGLVISATDTNKVLRVPAFKLTELGCEVFRLGDFEANEQYLRDFCHHAIKQGFEASIGRWRAAPCDKTEYYEMVPVVMPVSPT